MRSTHAFLFSELERTYYERAFGSELVATTVVGVPRHEQSWIDLIESKGAGQADELGEGFVLLLSRPAGSPYLPFERKRKALEDIYRVAVEEHGRKLVVKTHPKERQEGIFEEVFGRAAFGVTWTYSSLHPFTLATRAAWAVVFYSGVSVDLVRLGTPVIERLDLRGLPSFDRDDALRDEAGDPAFSYRYLGLVHGASDLESFRRQVHRVETDRAASVAELQARYHALFPDPAGSARLIADEILGRFSTERAAC